MEDEPNANMYYARPNAQNEDTENDPVILQERAENPGYGTMENNYPSKPDAFVAGAVRNEEIQQKREFRCLD